MSTFLSIPVELQLQVISNVHLNDIENFTLCCKVLHERSEERLMEQYARKRDLSTIAIGHVDNLTWDEDHQIRGVHPLLVLRDIFADPQTRLYTKTLIVGYLNIPPMEPDDFNDQEEAELDQAELYQVAAQFKHDTRLSRKVLEVQQCIYPGSGEPNLEDCPEAKKWTEKILSGDMAASASLLIAILPSLQTFRLVDRWEAMVDDSFFVEILGDMLFVGSDGMHDLTGINTFDNLTEVGLHGVAPGCSVNYKVLEGFIGLPSMRTIKGRVVDGLFDTCLPNCSELRSLEFYQSAISAKAFSPTFRATTKLQDFVYEFWADARVEDEQWEPHQIVEALKAHTKKSLRRLELTSLSEHDYMNNNTFYDCIDFEKGEPFLGSLCAFEVLEEIRLETMMFYKEVEDGQSWTQEEKDISLPKQEGQGAVDRKQMGGRDALVEPQRIVDVLPASTRKLRLVGSLSSEDATAMLKDLPVLKEERLPNLSSIFFEDIERSDIDENVVREVEREGVRMKFWQPSP